MRRVLVTGAGGFVGRSLIPALAAGGLSVLAVGRGGIGAVPRDVEFREIPDLRTHVDWQPLLRGIDFVIHLAGIAHADSSIPRSTYEQVNWRATESLASAAHMAGVQRLVFVSSVRAQSGPTADHVLTERDPPKPTDYYGASKLAAEEAIAKSGAPFTILRPALIYGAGVKGNMAQLMRLASLPLPLPFAHLANQRSFLAMENLRGAVEHVLRSDAALNETYLIADTTPVTVGEVIAALREGAGRRPRLFGVPDEWLSTTLRMVGRANVWERLGGTLVVDPAKLLAAGWRPRIDTIAAIRQLAAESATRGGVS